MNLATPTTLTSHSSLETVAEMMDSVEADETPLRESPGAGEGLQTVEQVLLLVVVVQLVVVKTHEPDYCCSRSVGSSGATSPPDCPHPSQRPGPGPRRRGPIAKTRTMNQKTEQR